MSRTTENQERHWPTLEHLLRDKLGGSSAAGPTIESSVTSLPGVTPNAVAAWRYKDNFLSAVEEKAGVRQEENFKLHFESQENLETLEKEIFALIKQFYEGQGLTFEKTSTAGMSDSLEFTNDKTRYVVTVTLRNPRTGQDEFYELLVTTSKDEEIGEG